jgi:UDP-4-amino-4,6-dideoxy-N-acetyl-beta-L-altrosamine transaminase
MSIIPYGRQEILTSDVRAVLEVLRSDFLTQGPVVPRFERVVAQSCGAVNAVAVNSATSALHVAMMALDVGPGDVVWTSPNSFVASSNAALFCGAKVDFVDIDPDTYNLSIVALEAKLEEAKEKNKLPKVVVPVHFAGQSCSMQKISKLAKQYNFKVVEDASHAIGGLYEEQHIGNCAYSDITVFSFHPVKIITTGEGGMALTNDDLLLEKMRLFRSHGITRDPALMTHPPEGPWYYQQITLGYNYRMTDLQAALGISQVQRLSEYVERRHKIADRYRNELVDLPITLPKQSDFAYSAYHLFVIQLDLEAIAPLTQLDVFAKLRERDIFVNLHYIPIHTQPYYQKQGFAWGDFPNAENYYRAAISIPMYPSLSADAQTHVISSLREILMK